MQTDIPAPLRTKEWHGAPKSPNNSWLLGLPWIDTEKQMVPRRGLEPPRLAAHGPEPCASTNSAIWARKSNRVLGSRSANVNVSHTIGGSYASVPRRTHTRRLICTLARSCASNMDWHKPICARPTQINRLSVFFHGAANGTKFELDF